MWLCREDARFLYKRIPADARNDTDVSASFQLLQRLWNKDYQVRSLARVQQSSSYEDPAWQPWAASTS